MRYTIIIQPTDNSGDHWLDSPAAKSVDAFAKWIHKTTGAAVSVYDTKHDRERLTLGNFDASRT